MSFPPLPTGITGGRVTVSANNYADIEVAYNFNVGFDGGNAEAEYQSFMTHMKNFLDDLVVLYPTTEEYAFIQVTFQSPPTGYKIDYEDL